MEATESPIFFFSDSEFLSKKLGREFVPGYRYSVAVTKPYKGTRKNPKPFHFYNILEYLRANYECVISSEGLEADDELCIYQVNSEQETIICSRDKDLRICPGFHFSWECGKQSSVGPTETDEIGYLIKKANGDVLGYGISFFYFQMLMGDAADNIPGCPKVGKVKAFNLLNSIDHKEHLNVVKTAYKKAGMSKEYFLEQGNLLWMRTDRTKGFQL